MSKPAQFLSPAKLNLFLHITGVRDDGYHNLQTLFQFIDFCDTLTFTGYTAKGDIQITNNIDGVPAEDNLIYRAATLLRQTTRCPLGVAISLEKRLPMGGGLGGGSSNAATTLVALNKLWGINLSTRQLAKLGLSLGADVPVFIEGHAALAEGVGEQLTPVDIPEPWYLLAIPQCHVETAKLFRDDQLTRNTKKITMRAFLDGAGRNDFEPIAKRLFPLINNVFNALKQLGEAKLTGTGSCIFCSYPNREQAQYALDGLQQQQLISTS
jgi:4-diphosphocytidyl-2-C-methyl-D-erythritol kinase